MAFNTAALEGLDRIQHIEQFLSTTPSVRTATLSFADGDTLKRFTVSDVVVKSTSQVACFVRRTDIADVDDPGWIYDVNVVTVAAGSFDALVSAAAGDAPAAAGEYPTESVTLIYFVF